MLGDDFEADSQPVGRNASAEETMLARIIALVVTDAPQNIMLPFCAQALFGLDVVCAMEDATD